MNKFLGRTESFVHRKNLLRLLFAAPVAVGLLALSAAPLAAAPKAAVKMFVCAPASAGCPVVGVLYVAASPAVPTEGGSCSAPDYNTITAAVAAAVSGDVIHVCAGTWRESELVLGVKDNLSFVGDDRDTTILDGELIDGTASSRHRIIDADGLTVNLANITLQHGAVSGDGNLGGAVRAGYVNGTDCAFKYNKVDSTTFGGGAIWTDGSGVRVSLVRCTLSYNGSSTSVVQGGAVFANGGTAFLLDSTFDHNSALGSGGAVQADIITANTSTFEHNDVAGSFNTGGALSAGTVNVTGSSFSYNHTGSAGATGYGGAIWGNNITIDKGSFDHNVAAGGGAIGGDVAITIKRSFFDSNGSSATYGGAIYNTAATVVASNSTFVANDSYFGGAVMAGSDMTLTNNTFTANTGSSTVGATLLSGGIVTLTNNILDTVTNGCWLTGTVNDVGGNLTTDPNDGAVTCPGSSVTSAQLALAPAADNGGPVKTVLIHRGSVAKDYGVDAACAAAPISNLDARGITRPVGSHCDSGAYEFDISQNLCCLTTTFGGGLYLPSQTVTVSITIATPPGRPTIQSVPNGTGSVLFFYCFSPQPLLSLCPSPTQIGSSVPLVNGAATLSNWIPPNGVGHYLISAYYPGDDYYGVLSATFAPITVVYRLPETGITPAPTLGLAGLLLVAGAVLVAGARRRRPVLTD